MTKIPISILDNVIGAVLGTVGIIASVGISLLPVAAELYSSISKNNKQPVKELKSKIDNGIKQMETEVKQMKQNLEISAKELSNTKNVLGMTVEEIARETGLGRGAILLVQQMMRRSKG